VVTAPKNGDPHSWHCFPQQLEVVSINIADWQQDNTTGLN